MLWKTLAGKCIYQKNGLQVFENFFYRWLCFAPKELTPQPKSIQTLINKRHPQKPKLDYLSIICSLISKTPGDVCMLGLGGGGLVHALFPSLQSHHLTVVENDPEIIKIAKTFFYIESKDNLSIELQPAELFIQNPFNTYQFIIVDLANPDGFPENCLNSDFFKNCCQITQDGGYLIVNLANQLIQNTVLAHIHQTFSRATIVFPIKKSSNILIIAMKYLSIQQSIDQINSHLGIKKIVWDSHWGHIGWI